MPRFSLTTIFVIVGVPILAVAALTGAAYHAANRVAQRTDIKPDIIVSSAMPPIHHNVPLPKLKPPVTAAVTPTPKPVKKHVRRGRRIACAEIPPFAYGASKETVRSVMKSYGATNDQVNDVLRCIRRAHYAKAQYGGR
jgi:hypothetical protein